MGCLLIIAWRFYHRKNESVSMTTRLYLDNAYCFENEATVIAISGSAIVLDCTCMYPGGGGQPPDSGMISFNSGLTLNVQTVSKDENGRLLHNSTDTIPDTISGMACKVKLNKERRICLMRYHTALHVFNTVMLRMYNGWITGVGIGTENSRIDFKVDNYNPEMAGTLEREINTILSKKLPVKAYYISEDEFQNRPDLIRTLKVRPPIENGKVRVVEIEGFEAQACGGTHVRNTSETGMLTIKKVENKGKDNRRFIVELSVSAINQEVSG